MNATRPPSDATVPVRGTAVTERDRGSCRLLSKS
jgi:hypothetical protein